jgi:hypothetical protein
MGDDYSSSYGRTMGPLGIDPLVFSGFLFVGLLIFVLYLLLPRGLRVQHFRAYPKRYAWSARSRNGGRRSGSRTSVCGITLSSLLSRDSGRLTCLSAVPI